MNETEHDERASQTSSKTTHSSSSVTSEATKARARAEAAHIRASSAERDAKIRIEKAKLDAELGAMRFHREAAAAMAEAEAFETAKEYRRALVAKTAYRLNGKTSLNALAIMCCNKLSSMPVTHPCPTWNQLTT